MKDNRLNAILDMDSLIPAEALAVVNERMRASVADGKYEAWDWMKPGRYSREQLIAKIFRHANKMDGGARFDEHGSHAAAIVCNGLMYLQLEIMGRFDTPDTEDLARGLHVGRKEELVEDQRKQEPEIHGTTEDERDGA